MSYAVWTLAEENAFVDFLVEHKSAAGDGGNFKASTLQQALPVVTAHYRNGAAKTVKTLQNKWASMRKTFRVIQAIKGVSGWTWDDDTGASITPDTASSWDDYVRSHPEARPFRNKGWVFFHRVSLIMPSRPTGTFVFHPSQRPSTPLPLPSPSPPSSPSPPLDLSDDDVADEITTKITKKRLREPDSPLAPMKRKRISQGDALMSVSRSIAAFSNSIAAALAPAPPSIPPLPPTPIRRSQAISVAQVEETHLTHFEMVAFIDVLRHDRNAVDVYLALRDAHIRKEWVRRQLSHV